MIIEISLIILTLAFVALVIYIIVTLKTLRHTLTQVDLTLVDVRKQLNEVGERAQEVSFDVQKKMEALNSVFNAVSNLGDFLECETMALEKKAFISSHQENSNPAKGQETIKVDDILEIVDIGIRLWKKIKKRSNQ